MAANDIEHNEWPDDEMSIKRFNPANPFSVPSGYFDELDQRILSSIRLDELGQRGFVGGFSVPDNYFDISAQAIQSRIHIEELASSDAEHFTVPADYFSTLEQQITSRIAVEEALQEHGEAFEVPEGYFDRLNKSILNKTVNQGMVMRKGVVRKLISSAAFKYASAACLALIVGAGIFIREMSTPAVEHNRSFLHKELSTIPADEIKSYMETHMDDNDVQHTVEIEGTPVDYSNLNTALENNSNQ